MRNMSVLKALKVTYLYLMVVYFVLMEWLSFMRSIFIDISQIYIGISSGNQTFYAAPG